MKKHVILGNADKENAEQQQTHLTITGVGKPALLSLLALNKGCPFTYSKLLYLKAACNAAEYKFYTSFSNVILHILFSVIAAKKSRTIFSNCLCW